MGPLRVDDGPPCRAAVGHFETFEIVTKLLAINETMASDRVTLQEIRAPRCSAIHLLCKVASHLNRASKALFPMRFPSLAPALKKRHRSCIRGCREVKGIASCATDERIAATRGCYLLR